jgi:hypothetical protein
MLISRVLYFKGGKKMNHKAQGTIEYLVIIAIVVVIALVVVGLLLQIMNQGGGIPETTSKTAWKSVEPWGIIEWVKNTDGNVTVIMRNNSYDSMNLLAVRLSTNANDQNSLDSYNVASGATVTRIIVGTGGCTSGTKYAYQKTGVFIDYNNSYISSKTQTAPADLVGTC